MVYIGYLYHLKRAKNDNKYTLSIIRCLMCGFLKSGLKSYAIIDVFHSDEKDY